MQALPFAREVGTGFGADLDPVGAKVPEILPKFAPCDDDNAVHVVHQRDGTDNAFRVQQVRALVAQMKPVLVGAKHERRQIKARSHDVSNPRFPFNGDSHAL